MAGGLSDEQVSSTDTDVDAEVVSGDLRRHRAFGLATIGSLTRRSRTSTTTVGPT